MQTSDHFVNVTAVVLWASHNQCLCHFMKC